MIKITSTDGYTAEIIDTDTGKPIRNVTEIEIMPIRFGEPVTAKLTCVLMELDIATRAQLNYKTFNKQGELFACDAEGNPLKETNG